MIELTKKEKKRRVREMQRDAQYPNVCFCEDHTWDIVLREEMWNNYYPLYQTKEKHKTTIYLCEVCHKEYTDEPAYA